MVVFQKVFVKWWLFQQRFDDGCLQIRWYNASAKRCVDDVRDGRQEDVNPVFVANIPTAVHIKQAAVCLHWEGSNDSTFGWRLLVDVAVNWTEMVTLTLNWTKTVMLTLNWTETAILTLNWNETAILTLNWNCHINSELKWNCHINSELKWNCHINSELKWNWHINSALNWNCHNLFNSELNVWHGPGPLGPWT